MELLWMTVISLVALSAAFFIGDRLQTTVKLHMDVRDQSKLKKQLLDIASQGVRFAEDAYTKGLIPLANVKPLATQFILSSLKETYHANVIEDSGVIEEIVEEIINPGDSIGV